MIIVTRLSGTQFAVNPDFLGRVESTPDTVLVMLDGARHLVQESVPEVVEIVTEFRASVVARALMLDDPSEQEELRPPVLLPVKRHVQEDD